MTYGRFLSIVIDRSVAEVLKSALTEPQVHAVLNASLQCSGKSLQELEVLWEDIKRRASDPAERASPGYWDLRLTERFVEQVVDQVAASQGPLTRITPTQQAYRQVVNTLGAAVFEDAV